MTEIIEAMAAAYDVDMWGPEKGGACESGIKAMRAALAEAERMGWRLVPVEPTEAMQDKGAAVSFMCAGQRVYTPTAWMAEQYRAMLAASPKP